MAKDMLCTIPVLILIMLRCLKALLSRIFARQRFSAIFYALIARGPLAVHVRLGQLRMPSGRVRGREVGCRCCRGAEDPYRPTAKAKDEIIIHIDATSLRLTNLQGAQASRTGAEIS